MPYKDPKALLRRAAKIDAERLALEKQAEKKKHAVAELLREALPLLRKAKLTQVEVPGLGRLYRDQAATATIDDWPALLACAAENPLAGLVHKRTSPSAIEAHMQATGGAVPGVKLALHEVAKLALAKPKKGKA